MMMDSDKELLQMAAKASGITVRWHDSGHYGPTMEIMEDEAGGPPWNPLTDDGDAFRLGIELKIRHRQYKGLITASNYIEACCNKDVEVREIVGTDPYSATRRAITRAAAEIGRQGKD